MGDYLRISKHESVVERSESGAEDENSHLFDRSTGSDEEPVLERVKTHVNGLVERLRHDCIPADSKIAGIQDNRHLMRRRLKMFGQQDIGGERDLEDDFYFATEHDRDIPRIDELGYEEEDDDRPAHLMFMQRQGSSFNRAGELMGSSRRNPGHRSFVTTRSSHSLNRLSSFALADAALPMKKHRSTNMTMMQDYNHNHQYQGRREPLYRNNN